MSTKGTRRWVTLLSVSFIAHIALTINSTSIALWNEQTHQGRLLTQQFSDAAAPLVLARDMVSLSVLTSRYENNPSIASVKIFSTGHELLAETLERSTKNRLFRATLQVQQQRLGHIELRLPTTTASAIVRANASNIFLSAALHFSIFLSGLFLSGRKSTHHNTPARAAVTPPTTAPTSSTHSSADHHTAHSPAENMTLLHIALDDPNGLLTRVNATMADDLLSLFDQFIDRAARLYGGSVSAPFSANGVLLRFTQADISDREFHAIAAAQLFLQLVEDSQEERRQHGRLCLNCKAGVLHNRDSSNIAAPALRHWI